MTKVFQFESIFSKPRSSKELRVLSNCFEPDDSIMRAKSDDWMKGEIARRKAAGWKLLSARTIMFEMPDFEKV